MPKKLPDDVHYRHYQDMFKVATHGIITSFKEEQNVRFEMMVGAIVIAFGGYFRITNTQWLVVILCIGIVLMAEIFNTAIEHIVDYICPKYDLHAKKIKDLASGAVLLICVHVAVIGLLIFIPYLI